MPKKAHSEEQIVAVLRQGEAGEKVADICRKVGISEGTYYLWKKQYAGLGINELRQLRQLRRNMRLMDALTLQPGRMRAGSSPSRHEAELFVDRTWKWKDSFSGRGNGLSGSDETSATSEPGFRPNWNGGPVRETPAELPKNQGGREGG